MFPIWIFGVMWRRCGVEKCPSGWEFEKGSGCEVGGGEVLKDYVGGFWSPDDLVGSFIHHDLLYFL